MALDVKELFEDQSYAIGANGKERKRIFQVIGADEPEDAATATGIPVRGEAYSGDSTLLATNIEAQADGRDDIHKVTVTYTRPSGGGGKPETPDEDDEWWTLDLGGQTVNIQAAYSQTAYGGTAKDVDVLVGVQIDDKNPAQFEIQGVDVYAPAGTLTVTTWKDPADLATLISNTKTEYGKYNSSTYYGFAAGELLFVGARIVNRIQGTEQELAEVEFVFSYSPNKAQADLPTFTDQDGNAFNITSGKKGWQYLWIMPVVSSNEGSTADEIVLRTQGAYVADVYKSSTFSGLGLTGSL